MPLKRILIIILAKNARFKLRNKHLSFMNEIIIVFIPAEIELTILFFSEKRNLSQKFFVFFA